jgi:hypothetical protein
MGANAISRPQTQRDSVRMFTQVKGSPFDSVRRCQTPRTSLDFPDAEEVTGSNPVRPTRHFLFLPYRVALCDPTTGPTARAKTCPGHRTAGYARSSPRAGTSAHIAVSAREGALPLPGSAEVFAGELARRLGPRLHRLGHDTDRRVCARAAKRQPAAVTPAGMSSLSTYSSSLCR